MAASIPIIKTTTNSSIRVKAFSLKKDVIPEGLCRESSADLVVLHKEKSFILHDSVSRRSPTTFLGDDPLFITAFFILFSPFAVLSSPRSVFMRGIMLFAARPISRSPADRNLQDDPAGGIAKLYQKKKTSQALFLSSPQTIKPIKNSPLTKRPVLW